MQEILIPIVLGGVVGLVLALTGAGGGILAVPLLVFGLHLTINQAAPVGLLAVGLAAAVGAVIGLQEGVVRYRAAALIGSVGMMLAPLGFWLARRIPDVPLMIAFAGVLAISAWRMYFQASRDSKIPILARGGARPICSVDPTTGRLVWTVACASVLATTGVVSGLLTGLLGIGGGFVIVPSLSRYSDIPMRNIIATSLAVIALVSTSGVATAMLSGGLEWPIALPFGAGAVVFLVVGRFLTRRLAGVHLQRAFAVVCAAVAVLLVARGLGWIAV